MSPTTYTQCRNGTDPKWWRDPGMRKGMGHILILYSAVYSLGYDGSLLTGLQALPVWMKDFGEPAGTKLGLIAASYYLPKIPLTFIVSWLLDRYGRKLPLYLGGFFMLAGAIFGGASQSTGQFIGSRILLGIGTCLAQVTASTLIPELAHPRLRHFAGGYLLTTFYIGSIFASWLTFAMVYYPGGTSSWCWRIPTLVQGLGPLVLCCASWSVPESPRWLYKTGRQEKAHQILATYHANGDRDDELVLFELQEIKTQIQVDIASRNTKWSSFFKTAGNRRRFFVIILVALCAQWSGNGVVQYYLVPILKSVGVTKAAQQAGINGGLAVWNWFCSLAGASMVERVGRRKLFLSAFMGMLFSFILITGLSGEYAHSKANATGAAMIPFIFIFMGFYSFSITPLPLLYVPEISPMGLRAKSGAVFSFAQNCAQSFNQFANPVAMVAIGWKYYFVYIGVLIVFLGLFYIFVRETRGLTTEEAAVVYDDDSDLKDTDVDVTDADMVDEKSIDKSMDKNDKYGGVATLDMA